MKNTVHFFWILILINIVTIKTNTFSTLAIAFPNAGFNNLLLAKRTVTTSGSITTGIESELDDSEVYNNSHYTNGEYNLSDLYFGAHNNEPVWGAFRFRIPTAIPVGATITSASLSIYGESNFYWGNGSDYLLIIANDSANAPQVSGSADAPGAASGYYFTAAPGLTSGGANVKVRWPSAGSLTWDESGVTPNISSDISALIQYLANKHGGLSAGSYVQLWIYTDINKPGGGPEVQGVDYGHATIPAPMLVINWIK